MAEILQRVEQVPAYLSDLIVDSAEGNPFYVEEMVKMLIDQGVIERGIGNYESGITNEAQGSGGAGVRGSGGEADSSLVTRHSSLEDHWTVRADRLAGLKVPPTLTALLQARLDGLPRPEREALQRASVVGRLFWDDAVAELLNSKREMISPTLDSIRRRELVFRRARSSFAPAEEYIFKHALLRDVAYETVLLKHRTGFHGRVAAWLEAHAGERIGEYLGLIAEHFVLAENLAKAATYLQRIGDEAVAIGAFKAARPVLERALTLRAAAGETSGPAVTRASIGLGIACRSLGDFPAAEAALERGLAGARETGDVAIEAEALAMLAEVTRANGEYDRARAYADAALPLGRAAGGRTLTLTQLRAAAVYWSTGDLAAAEARAAEALAAARALGDFAGESSALNLTGLVALSSRDSARAAEFFNESLALARRANHLSFEARALVNLCAAAEIGGDHPAAREYGKVAVERYRELGMQHSLTIALANLAETDLKMGDVAAARRGARETLSLTLELGHMSRILMAIQIFALILTEEGRPDRALSLFGLALAHPALEYQSKTVSQEAIARLGLSEDEIEAGLAAGAALDLETVVQEILEGKW
jgi:tetratricopeptide (TPR) repeat protein